MKYLITGGSGFIGSHLTEKLTNLGHKIVVIDNLSIGKKKNLVSIKKKITFIKEDIRNFEKIKNLFKKVDCVFHLAALADIVPSIDNPDDYYSTNVTGTFNVLKACRLHGVPRVIYSASSSCYGIPDKYPTSEDSEISPQYPYALTKRLGEELVLHFGKIYKINTTSLRFFNVYGTRARTSGTYGAVFGVFLAQKIKEKPLTIVGDGRQTRDFIHVYDVVRALVLSIKKGKSGHVYNLGSGVETSVNLIAKIIGGKKIFVPKRPGEPQRSIANIKKIKNHLKWKPKISIKYGISMLMKNLDDWTNAPLWTPKKIKKATKLWFKYLK